VTRFRPKWRRQSPRLKLAGLCLREVSTDQIDNPPISDSEDYEPVYEQLKPSVSPDKTAVFQGIQQVPRADSLFYTTVSFENGPSFTAYTRQWFNGLHSQAAEASLLASAPMQTKCSADDVVIIGYGGHRVTPTAMYDLSVCVYRCKMIIPVLIVPAQTSSKAGSPEEYR